MEFVISNYLFVLGTALGSFALVLADRMHAGRDWVRGRSVCEHCSHQLAPRDLVPLLSWTLQRGRCRYCGVSLGSAYPLTELGLGVAVSASYLLFPYELHGIGITLFVLWVVGLVIMTALVVSDLKWYLLPSKLVYPLSVIGAAHWLIATVLLEQTDSVRTSVLSLAAALFVGAGLFWALHRFSGGRWIGDGDYRLGVAMGLFLGSPLTTWMALFFASLSGLLFATPKLIRTRRRASVKIPYGPFLIVGLIVSYLVGQQILDWYTNTFLYL